MTLRGDFDQQLISWLSGLGAHGDPCAIASPAYIFRRGSTGAYHGQALMRGPEDENWYGRDPSRNSTELDAVFPEFDDRESNSDCDFMWKS
jgi:hypothetical protein